METIKYKIIKEFCDLDMKIDEISRYIDERNEAGLLTTCVLKQKEAMLAYSRSLADRIFLEGILDEFKKELEYSADARFSVVKDEPKEHTKTRNASERTQDDINKEFEKALKDSMKRYFGMDVDVKINKFNI